MMRISKFTVIFSAYMILSSFFMQRVWAILEDKFGEKSLLLFFIFLCLMAVWALIYKNICSGFSIKKLSLMVVVCIAGFIFAWRQPYFSERAHVLQFAFLGWLVMRDLSKENKNIVRDIFIAFIFVAMIGVFEESYQKLLPWRVCEIRDIITDAWGGLLGIILYCLS